MTLGFEGWFSVGFLFAYLLRWVVSCWAAHASWWREIVSHPLLFFWIRDTRKAFLGMVSWVSTCGLTEADHSYPVRNAKDWLLGCGSERMGLLKKWTVEAPGRLTWLESPGRVIPCRSCTLAVDLYLSYHAAVHFKRRYLWGSWFPAVRNCLANLFSPHKLFLYCLGVGCMSPCLTLGNSR